MTREFRTLHGVAVRATKKGRAIEGYAAVFNEQSLDLGGFRELIIPGAFKRAIREKQDVRCLFNHDVNLVLGRTRNGTLQLAEDSKGLNFECELPDTRTAREVYPLVERGDVSGCSFSFTVHDPKNGQRWSDSRDADGQPITLRQLLDVDLFDVGPVTNPAYEQTTVDARSLWPDGPPPEVRSHLRGSHQLDLQYPPAGAIEDAARMARRALLVASETGYTMSGADRASLQGLIDREGLESRRRW